jgi:hypothetical protein
MERLELRPFTLEGFHDRRDRKRRNQRIAAGLVGIAVFVAAVWIVTSVGSLDRSETSVVPGGDVTGPAETGPAETGPPPARASAAPDVVNNRGRCGFPMIFEPGEARWWLELTNLGDRIGVRFEVHRIAQGGRWTIWIFRFGGLGGPDEDRSPLGDDRVFQGTRVASDGGDFVVQRSYLDNNDNWDRFRVIARERETGQVCNTFAWIG